MSGEIHSNLSILLQAPAYFNDASSHMNNAISAMNSFNAALNTSEIKKRNASYAATYNYIISDISAISGNISTLQSNCINIINIIKQDQAGEYSADEIAMSSSALVGEGAISAGQTGATVAVIDDETASDRFWNFVNDAASLIERAVATIVDMASSLLLGLVKLLEGIVDGAAMLAATVVSGVGNIINFIFRTNINTEAIEQWAQSFVSSTDWVNAVGGAFYSTGVGSWIAGNSFLNNTARGIFISAGKWVGIGIVGFFTGGAGAAVVAGASGYGNTSDAAFRAGHGFWASTGIGLVSAAIDAYTGYGVGKVANSFRGAVKMAGPNGQVLELRGGKNGVDATLYHLENGAATATSPGTALTIYDPAFAAAQGGSLIKSAATDVVVQDFATHFGKTALLGGLGVLSLGDYIKEGITPGFATSSTNPGGVINNQKPSDLPTDTPTEETTPPASQTPPSTEGGSEVGGISGGGSVPSGGGSSGSAIPEENEGESKDPEYQDPGKNEEPEDSDKKDENEEPKEPVENPEEPEEPTEPEDPENPEEPEEPTEPEEPENPEEPEEPIEPEEPAEPEEPGTPVEPINPDENDPQVTFINVGPEKIVVPDEGQTIQGVVDNYANGGNISGGDASGGAAGDVGFDTPIENPTNQEPEFIWESEEPIVSTPDLENLVITPDQIEPTDYDNSFEINAIDTLDVPDTSANAGASAGADLTQGSTDTNMDTMIGMGGISAGATLTGVYASANKKTSENKEREAAQKLKQEDEKEGFNQ